MIKKILIPILMLSMVFFTQCKEENIAPQADSTVIKKGPGGGGHTEPVGNNLSFPVFAVDGFSIAPIIATQITVPYVGDYPGLSDEEIADLVASGPWYPQKVDGNLWQAEFSNADNDLNVTFIDWGDVIEVVNPKIGRPFRLEVTLYCDISLNPMNAYTMALLANPSSQDEVQGTNNTKYEGNWATVASSSPGLIVQKMSPDAEPVWDGDKWTGEGVDDPATGFAFAPELNVGGKYIYGASQGGWKPTSAGTYRITFYTHASGNVSFIHLENAEIGNYSGNTNDGTFGDPENTAATAIVDAEKNLTYVDVTVVTGGGGGG